MDGVGWAGTALILSPIFATILVVALLTAFATHRQKKRRRDGNADRRYVPLTELRSSGGSRP